MNEQTITQERTKVKKINPKRMIYKMVVKHGVALMPSGAQYEVTEKGWRRIK